MSYFPNTPSDQEEMLRAIGVQSIEELFAVIPEEFRLRQPLNLPAAMTELELSRYMSEQAVRNQPAGQAACFLGAGSYDHFIPAVVDFLASRSEFYTAYTPYQPEASQGSLQAFFEYQTLITQLTGMDVSNASLYEGASAMAEAVLMAMAATGRQGRVVTAANVHPEYRQTLATYLANLPTEIVTLPTPEGIVRPQDLYRELTQQTACIVFQHPNFFGCLEETAQLVDAAHSAGALAIVVFDPISLGLLKRPGDYGADIAVAEGQSLGIPMSFGGPYLGILACRESLLRRMPGRLVGQTTDRHGRRCWVLTLQTREQHIRREKATSNICTNQGLMALRASIYLALMGPQGLREVANLCLQKTHYALDLIRQTGQWQLPFDRPVFKEFVIRRPGLDMDALVSAAVEKRIFPGVPLGRWYPELADCLLVAVTEKRTKTEIDRWADLLAK
ncbi:MAG: aminomethyl-transferring glycine dehydrogenase subunit GcvPA [Thermoguttaceae bacterium]|nr:aminomethyl-transferring glycine dehydrogenase subunit GcvPA [Thermoguttaceae bacterium]MDW8038024.1 aminomethyl-transferring glycine dehydrogenase subunit GcvPA [Thermoguttaceae bacterium]